MIKICLYLIILLIPSLAFSNEVIPLPDPESAIMPFCADNSDWKKNFEHADMGDLLATRKAAAYFSVCRNDKKAKFKWTLKSAEIGSADDLAALAMLYEGQNDFGKAIKYYHLAAAKGDSNAAFSLAKICLHKKARCYKGEELNLLELAARDNYFQAAELLADKLISETNMPLHQEKAVGWLIYANRLLHCALPGPYKEKLSTLRTQMNNRQFATALALSHPKMSGEIDGKPIDGESCPDESIN